MPQSPHHYVKRAKTPTLVIHGELDYRVPATQALQYYDTLKAKDVPARLVYFPDENHWILKPQNSRLWYREFFAWLARVRARAAARAQAQAALTGARRLRRSSVGGRAAGRSLLEFLLAGDAAPRRRDRPRAAPRAIGSPQSTHSPYVPSRCGPAPPRLR